LLDLFKLTQPLRDKLWFGYVFALISIAAAFGVRLALGPAALKFPFIIFLTPVVLTTFLGGLRAGVFAAVVAGVLSDLTLIAPPGSLLPRWPDGWIAMAFYVLTVGVDVAIIHGMTVAFGRASAAEDNLTLLNEQLEQRVTERTDALERQVAERRRAEDQVRQLQKIESVGQLTGGIAHDFNNMLAVVIGSLEIARRRKDDPVRVASCIGNAEEAAKRAAQLTNRLLAFSRQQPLSPQVLDANKLVSGMSDLLMRTLGETIWVNTVLGGDLWRTFADVGQVENAILNLAVNARDAMPEGGILTIETANADLDDLYASQNAEVQPGQYVLISVTDIGTGISPEVLEHAFEPFYTTKGVGRGTGLGLSQVYGFVKQTRGHVSIDSEVGQGTTVKIYLPRHIGDEGGTVASAADRLPAAQAHEMILVVEDEAQVRHMSVDALRELGYTVVQATNGHEALDMIANQPKLDLLFTDIVMPEMNGRQLADKAKAIRPGLRVIYTTGYTRNAVIHNGVLDPGVALLQKPFTILQLARKVRDVLDEP
jgi:signal transduction histidine kinase/CheY-like chemotaxis protein